VTDFFLANASRNLDAATDDVPFGSRFAFRELLGALTSQLDSLGEPW